MDAYGMIAIAYAVGFAFFGFCFCWFTSETKPEKMKLVRETKCKTRKSKCRKCKCGKRHGILSVAHVPFRVIGEK